MQNKYEVSDGDGKDGLLPSQKFKIEAYLTSLDRLVAELTKRLKAYCCVLDKFGFLANPENEVGRNSKMMPHFS